MGRADRHGRIRAGAVLLTFLPAACGPVATSGPGCRPIAPPVPLPEELVETSGAAVSGVHPGIIWTHADGSVGELFAVDSAGGVRARLTLSLPTRDWEDLSVSGCGEGDSCIYMADTGDNGEQREPGSTRILRAPEPRRLGAGRLEVESFPVRLPDGPRDVEALLVLPGERPFLVTKGRNHPVIVYRYPPPLRPDTVTLEEVQRLSEGARFLPRQVTGGSVSPDGSVVALRTYESLHFYRMEADTLVPLEDGVVNLRTLQEPQGEGVGLGPGGVVALTSEGGPATGAAALSRLRCAGLSG